jgi:deoxyribonuclease V
MDVAQAMRAHAWNLAPDAALALQRRLAQEVVRADDLPQPVGLVAGIDVSANDQTGLGRAAVVVLRFPALDVVEVARHTQALGMAYAPGMLSFREIPVILGALAQVRHTPDLLIVDGHGIAHPRRIGIAAHLGVILRLPALGCAKSILRGKHEPIPDEVGARADLVDHGEVIGVALRTRRHANPIYISIGNRISLPTAVAYVSACGRGYRLPEPTRLAHNYAGATAIPDLPVTDSTPP